MAGAAADPPTLTPTATPTLTQTLTLTLTLTLLLTLPLPLPLTPNQALQSLCAALAMENLCVARLPWEDGEPRECATAFAYFVDFEAHRGDPKPKP